MGLNYLLFVLYAIACTWLITRSAFARRSGLDTRELALLFAVKVIAGVALGWISLHWYGPGNDYWDVHRESLKEYDLLLNDPGAYFRNFTSSGYDDAYGGLFSSFDSFWNDLKNNVVIKTVSVFNLFSRGNYYINSLFFNSLIFFGHLSLFRLFSAIYPGRKWAVITGTFLLPSCLYFSSGIHKDAIVFLSLAVFLYLVHRSLQEGRAGWKRLLLMLLMLVLLFVCRNFVFLLLLPALLAWLLGHFTRRPAWISFTSVYLLGLILLLTAGSITGYDPLRVIIRKQADFAALPETETALHPGTLSASFGSFAEHTPRALAHVLLRPWPGERPLSLLPFALEWMTYLVLFICFIFFGRKSGYGHTHNSFLLFCLFFCGTLFLFIGYIVPNMGSLIRYRALYLPLLITPLIAAIDWDKCWKMARKRS